MNCWTKTDIMKPFQSAWARAFEATEERKRNRFFSDHIRKMHRRSNFGGQEGVKADVHFCFPKRDTGSTRQVGMDKPSIKHH